MRILIATSFYPPRAGGIERYTAALACQLASEDHTVDVLTADIGEPVAVGSERLMAVPTLVMRDRLPFPNPVRRLTWQTFRSVRFNGYDAIVVQSHLFLSNIIASLAVPKSVVVVWINHGTGHVSTGSSLLDRFLHGYEHLLARMLRSRADWVLGVSESAAAWTSHLGATPAGVATNALTEESVTAIPERRARGADEPLRVIFVGRLLPGKGAREVVAICRDAAAAGLRIHLELVGSGPETDAVRADLASSGLQYQFHGDQPHSAVLQLLHQADVFLYPSTYPEGFPTVLLEAAASGCVVVSRPVPGLTALLGVRSAEHTFSSGTEAVRILRRIAKDPDLAARRADEIRQRVRDQFTWRQTSMEITSFIGKGRRG